MTAPWMNQGVFYDTETGLWVNRLPGIEEPAGRTKLTELQKARHIKESWITDGYEGEVTYPNKGPLRHFINNYFLFFIKDDVVKLQVATSKSDWFTNGPKYSVEHSTKVPRFRNTEVRNKMFMDLFYQVLELKNE